MARQLSIVSLGRSEPLRLRSRTRRSNSRWYVSCSPRRTAHMVLDLSDTCPVSDHSTAACNDLPPRQRLKQSRPVAHGDNMGAVRTVQHICALRRRRRQAVSAAREESCLVSAHRATAGWWAPSLAGRRKRKRSRERSIVWLPQACIYGACSPQWAPMILALTREPPEHLCGRGRRSHRALGPAHYSRCQASI
jgi:hypothetical protein